MIMEDDLIKGLRILVGPLSGFIGQKMRTKYGKNWWEQVRLSIQNPYDLPLNGDYATLVDSLDIANCCKPTYYIDSAIRDYLITVFYNNAFNTQEKKMIETRYLDTTGGSVSDPVFLLSDTEADRYFSSDSARRSSDGHEWFLRSVNSVLLDVLNYYALIPMYVKYNGSIYQYDWTVDYERGVRPAIWLDISSYVEKLEENE